MKCKTQKDLLLGQEFVSVLPLYFPPSFFSLL